ncbi:MAG: TonB-dependent receptor [Xanthomonadaceae bacterium]|nr:TonB-dependent receptor [Xanthomonadaceae bacterium]
MRKHMPLRKKLLASLITAGVATTGVMPGIVWAQSANATLMGTAPANTQVTARNLATGQIRATQSAADGSYALVGLPPGTYRVAAGTGPAQTVTLSVAMTGTLNLTAAAATPAPASSAQTLAAVNVIGRPLFDNKTSQVGETVSIHTIQTLPQITRNFLEFADTVPGMIFSVDSSGHTSLQGGAMDSSTTNVYINGVGQKNYLFGGPVGQNASQGNPFPQLAISQYRVLTSNYKAEYDQVSSAAVTALTKYGTNEFHGQVYDSYTDSNWRDSTPAEAASGNKAFSVDKDYGFALGGPIIKDKMHFFITDEVKRYDTPVSVIPGVTSASGVASIPALLPDAAQAAFGPSNLPFWENLFYGNMDWEPTENDRIEFRAQVRNEKAFDNIGGVTAASAGIQVKNTVKRYELYWSHGTDAWFNELLFSYQNAFYVPQQITDGVGSAYTFGTNNNLVLQTGAPDPRAEQNKGQKGPSIKDDLTFTDFQWHGDHIVKTGFVYRDIDLVAQDAGNATAQAFYNVCSGNAAVDSSYCPPGFVGTNPTPYKTTFAVTNPGFSPIVKSSDKQFGAYIQDDWTVNDHLTLNLGVRWDIERNPSYLNWVTPGNVVDALLNGHDPNAPAGLTYAQQLAMGGVNINNYISNGHNRSAYKNEWQPRLGFSYDLNGDSKHVIFGGAGRSYDRNLYDYLQLEQTKFALEEPSVYFSSPTQACAGSPCFPWDPSYANNVAALQSLVTGSTAGYEVDMFNNHLKVPYSDQFSIGMRNRLGEWNSSVTVARVLSYDGLAATLGNRYPDGSFWMNGGQPWGDGVPGFGPLILWNNGIQTRSTQLLLSLVKPWSPASPWSVSVAYTYTNASQNRDITQHYSFDQATINDYPFILSNAAPKHRLVVTGSIDGPWGMTYSAKVTLATPTPYDGYIFYNYPATAPNGANNLPVGATPPGNGKFLFGGNIFGYRSVDFAVIKDWTLPGTKTHLQFRGDLINAFNFKNLVDINSNYPNFYPLSYIGNGNITGYPREFKASFSVIW